ncbi:unnamed protein product [marine sediment metagenome]|uniref:Uncharacterized protein n=1 Tax=marine sediment metagenome TaxID=412755 RepID=X1S2W2_9ZZZZ
MKIFIYSFRQMTAKQQTALRRDLTGWDKVVKEQGVPRAEHVPGLLDGIEGWEKPAPRTYLIPDEHAERVRELFRKSGLTWRELEVREAEGGEEYG